MSGVLYEITLDPAQFRQVTGFLSDLVAFDREQLMYEIGALVEDQTKRRINDEKTSPEGAYWPAWSRPYAATRGNSHSLLVGEGNLRDSIANYTSGETAEVGTNLIYGATHQFGRGGIPARPYLGISSANAEEITDLVVGRLQELLQ